ncbi:MAG: DUF4239 domain-containing protein [Terriglobales bacterium]
MDTSMGAVIVIGTSMLLSIAGLLVVRRYTNVDWLKRHHEVASYFFLMIGTLYAVLIAFAIYVVWSASKEAGANLEHEATEVADLSRLSMAMPDPVRRKITPALTEYLNSVVEDEFPGMEQGRESQRTWAAVQNLWDVYGTIQPETPRLQAYFAESLKHLSQLSDYRRTRLFASRGTVPATLWYLLLSGGVLLVVFTYFVGHESVWSQAAMTAALTGILAFSLFLVWSLDSPYSGVASVTPQPFRLELAHVAARMPK